MKAVLAATVLSIAMLTGGVVADAADATSTDTAKSGDPTHNTSIRQQLEERLTKAGYTSVKVMPSSFFVQAKDKKGEPVSMVIGPDSFTEVTELKAGRASADESKTGAPAKETNSPDAPKK